MSPAVTPQLSSGSSTPAHVLWLRAPFPGPRLVEPEPHLVGKVIVRESDRRGASFMETIILKNVFTASVPVRFSVEKFQSREESTTIMNQVCFTTLCQ